mmetsp:Transcript_97098/g.275061  ORF Transcript_97098/g.275061 Transcript_97098/m.275061 type:complete len:207 (+) Transcript_97098:2171-2791(+)
MVVGVRRRALHRVRAAAGREDPDAHEQDARRPPAGVREAAPLRGGGGPQLREGRRPLQLRVLAALGAAPRDHPGHAGAPGHRDPPLGRGARPREPRPPGLRLPAGLEPDQQRGAEEPRALPVRARGAGDGEEARQVGHRFDEQAAARHGHPRDGGALHIGLHGVRAEPPGFWRRRRAPPPHHAPARAHDRPKIPRVHQAPHRHGGL